MNTKDKKSGIRFNPELYINFIYHSETNTVEVYKNGELITDGGGVTPEELMIILAGYVSKEKLNVILDPLVTKEELTLALRSYIKMMIMHQMMKLEYLKLILLMVLKFLMVY